MYLLQCGLQCRYRLEQGRPCLSTCTRLHSFTERCLNFIKVPVDVVTPAHVAINRWAHRSEAGRYSPDSSKATCCSTEYGWTYHLTGALTCHRNRYYKSGHLRVPTSKPAQWLALTLPQGQSQQLTNPYAPALTSRDRTNRRPLSLPFSPCVRQSKQVRSNTYHCEVTVISETPLPAGLHSASCSHRACYRSIALTRHCACFVTCASCRLSCAALAPLLLSAPEAPLQCHHR